MMGTMFSAQSASGSFRAIMHRSQIAGPVFVARS